MIIPWHVDVPENHRPFLNWLIIAAIILAFLVQTASTGKRSATLASETKKYENYSIEEMAKELGADVQRVKEIEQAVEKKFADLEKSFPIRKKSKKSKDFEDPLAKMKEDIVKEALLKEYFVQSQVRPYILRGWTVKGLLGNMWLHGGIMHMAGNLLFLWIFGNAVCSKMGNLLYAPFYILVGLMAGVAHLMFQGGGALGASGAINGVVGMFLVLFPTNTITCYYFFWFICFRPILGSFSLASFWMILFWLAFDIYGAVAGGGSVGYFAHLGGFAAGVGVGIILLKCKIIKMDKWEKSVLDVLADPFNKAQPESNTKYNVDLRQLAQTENSQSHEFVEQTQKSTPELQQVLSNSDFLRPPPPEQPEPEEQPEPAAPELQQVLSNSDFFRPPPAEQPEPSPPPPQDQQLIRFTCDCGKKIKMASKHAGRMGKCPQCRKRIRIPHPN